MEDNSIQDNLNINIGFDNQSVPKYNKKQSAKKSRTVSKSLINERKGRKPSLNDLEIITEMSSKGYSLEHIAYMLTDDEEQWDNFFQNCEEIVLKAFNDGKMQREIEAIDWIREGARNCGSWPALKYYVEEILGWNSTSTQELPSGIDMELILPDEEETE